MELIGMIATGLMGALIWVDVVMVDLRVMDIGIS